jgi:hypothetical protein
MGRQPFNEIILLFIILGRSEKRGCHDFAYHELGGTLYSFCEIKSLFIRITLLATSNPTLCGWILLLVP